jgi:hypothetical protein
LRDAGRLPMLSLVISPLIVTCDGFPIDDAGLRAQTA